MPHQPYESMFPAYSPCTVASCMGSGQCSGGACGQHMPLACRAHVGWEITTEVLVVAPSHPSVLVLKWQDDTAAIVGHVQHNDSDLLSLHNLGRPSPYLLLDANKGVAGGYRPTIAWGIDLLQNHSEHTRTGPLPGVNKHLHTRVARGSSSVTGGVDAGVGGAGKMAVISV